MAPTKSMVFFGLFGRAACSSMMGETCTDGTCRATPGRRDQILLQKEVGGGHLARASVNESVTDCSPATVQRRRRDATMCACRRRATGAIDVPRGFVCEGDAITSCGDNCPRVTISGRQILVDGKPFHMKGINWNPLGWNRQMPVTRDDYFSLAEGDANMMAAAGINAVRTYGPLTDTRVLDILWERGIWVLNTAYAYGGQDPAKAKDTVMAVKDHPSILMWVIGNEWNYNGIYADLGKSESVEKLNAAAAAIKEVDANHPVSSIYGGIPSSDTIYSMPEVDVWGLNIYSGISFGSTFRTWAARSSKPMYFGEYGADAFNALTGQEDQQAQADATTVLTNEIVQNSAVNVNEGGVCFGGLLFEFADEWWKDGNGSPAEHDNNGIAPGGGPHPDMTFNEEWWGIVDIARKPRLAYEAYKATINPGYSGAPSASVVTPAPSPSPSTCSAGSVQRRRRNVDMCACRRRSGSSDLESGWTCRGPSIVREEEAL